MHIPSQYAAELIRKGLVGTAPAFAQDRREPPGAVPATAKPKGRGKRKGTAGGAEKQIQAACLEYLEFIGAYAVRVNSGAIKLEKRFIRFNSQPGCPDILACIGGTFAGIEVKRADGKLSEKQSAALDAIRAAGGLGIVVRSVAELEAALRLEGLVPS